MRPFTLRRALGNRVLWLAWGARGRGIGRGHSACRLLPRRDARDLLLGGEREARRAADESAPPKVMLEKPASEKPAGEEKPAAGNGNGQHLAPGESLKA
jgi:hypothetical protein